MATFQGLLIGVNTILNTFMERQERRQLEKLKEKYGGGKEDNFNVSGGCGTLCNKTEAKQFVMDQDTDCVVCYEELDNLMTSDLACGHTFHTECIRQWFKYQTNCPLCRTYI